MSRRGWALGAVAALVVLVATAGGFLIGRRTPRASEATAAVTPPTVPPSAIPATPAPTVPPSAIPATPAPTQPPAIATPEPTRPDLRATADAFIAILERLGVQSRGLAKSLRTDPALRLGVPDSVLNRFADELDLAAIASDDAIECVKRGDSKGADLAFNRSVEIFNRVRTEMEEAGFRRGRVGGR